MKTLKFIREKENSNLLSLGIEGEESVIYTVNLKVYAEIGAPSVGDVLDDLQLELICECDEYIRATRKALNILSYADNNRRNLSAKLARAGFSRDVCLRVVNDMLGHGYINERDQLERIILVEANTKLRGPMKIVPALAAKGYATSDIREVMGELIKRREVDFDRNAEKLLSKKLPDCDGEEKKKFLYKNGYKV